MLAQRRRARVVEERRLVVDDREVAGFLDVVGGDERHPEQVVRHLRDVPLLGQRMPPVVDRAVGELVRGVQPELRAAARRVDRQVDLRVLQLVAEAEGAALLVVAAAAPQARGDRLIADPVVGDGVEDVVRRLDAVRAEQRAPRGAGVGQGALDDAGVAVPVEQRFRLGAVLPRGKRVDDDAPLSRGELQRRAERGDGVLVAAEARRPRFLGERRRRAVRAAAAEEQPLVPLRVAHRRGAAEGADVGEVGVPVAVLGVGDVPHPVAGEDGAARRVVVGPEEELVELAPRGGRDAAAPLEERGEREAPRAAGGVDELDAPELDGEDRVDEEGPLGLDPAGHGAERRVAEAVPAGELVRRGPRRRRRERPQVAGLVVAQVEELPRAVLGELLAPVGDRAELGVVDPAEAGAGLAHGEPHARVGDDVGPRTRRLRIEDDVLARGEIETAVAVGGREAAPRVGGGIGGVRGHERSSRQRGVA